MTAIIIGIGDELVCGETVNTNSAHLARELGRLGIDAIGHWTIGDRREAIASAIARAAESADLVLVTGGLGPTADDLTRQGLADAMAAELILDQDCLSRIEAFFRRRGRTMVAANRSQAMIPVGAEPLANPVGTAPGIAARLGEAQVFVMPGVPHEMEQMFRDVVAPRLPRGKACIVHHSLHAFGTGESDIASRIADLMARSGPTIVGTTVSAGMISVRITSRASRADQADTQIENVAAEIRSRLGRLLVGEGETTMASAVGELLGRSGQTLATAESCTGGLVGEMITSVPGASDYYLGGVVSYADAVKEGLLGVPADTLAACGAVSEPVAAAMANGCRSRFGSDWAIAITGIAGPTGGTEDKPVGLVYVALAGPAGEHVQRHLFSGTRQIVRVRSALTGLNCLRLALLDQQEQAQ